MLKELVTFLVVIILLVQVRGEGSCSWDEDTSRETSCTRSHEQSEEEKEIQAPEDKYKKEHKVDQITILEEGEEDTLLPSINLNHDRLDQRYAARAFQTLNLYSRDLLLPVKGIIPSYVNGSLIRNGFGKFEFGEQKFKYLFDAYGMLYKYKIDQGKVYFTNQILESDYYNQSVRTNSIPPLKTFGGVEPCHSLFSKIMSHFVTVHDNMNVAIWRDNNNLYAVSDMPHALEFDPISLKAKRLLAYEDDLSWKIPYLSVLGSAHPRKILDDSGDSISYVGHVNAIMGSGYYSVYRLKKGSKKRQEIVRIKRDYLCYIHSFALTKRYMLLVEYPHVWDFNEVGNPFGSGTLSKALKWTPQYGVNNYLIDLDHLDLNNPQNNYKVIKDTNNIFFSYHHVNAFEENGYLFYDIVAYDDAHHMQTFYIQNLKNANHDFHPCGSLRRYRVPLNNSSEEIKLISQSKTCLDLPRYNENYSGKKYRYVYAVGQYSPGDWWNCLVKLDNKNIEKENKKERAILTWAKNNHFPSEPIFIPDPMGKEEDDGVLVSVVLNSEKGESYLLFLNSKDFSTLATAHLPYHIPFNSHGEYYHDI